jgi:hypothetical protein
MRDGVIRVRVRVRVRVKRGGIERTGGEDSGCGALRRNGGEGVGRVRV